jgi:signal transduction histidine kinase
MASFVLLAAIGATAVACTLAIALFLLTGWISDAWLAWRQRFFSNGFAVLTITPPIFLAATGELVGSRHPRARRHAELALVAIGLLAVGMLIFGRTAPGSEIMPALLLAPLPFLLWAAVRLGPGGLCCALILVTCVSWATVYVGRWPFATHSASEAVLSVHAYLLTISVPMMFLATLVEERRRGEEETRRQRDELAHALRVNTLGELTASVAHELNQPLTAIMTNAQAASRLLQTVPARSDAIRDALSGVVEAANRAALVIRRLRALFRKEPGERVRLDLNTLIESTVGLLGPDLQQKRIVMRFARNDTLPRVLGDPVQLQQVVLNLIMNAVEAVAGVAEGRRVIAIDAGQTASGRLVFSVSDSGVGVSDPAGLEHIFEHFHSSKPHGLGMGLTISRSIVEDHNGRIWATSNAGPGLTLHVELPALAGRTRQIVRARSGARDGP